MFRRVAQDEQGVALVLAIMTMLVLSLGTASVLFATAVNHRSAKNSADANHAFALAEHGLAFAEGRLYSAPTTAESVLVPGTTMTPEDDTGTIAYHGTLCTPSTIPACNPKVWTLFGTGTVNGVSRTVSAQVTVPTVTTQAQSTTTDTTVWNYLYSDSTAACSQQFSGNVNLNVPLYTRGGLCLSGNVTYKGADLEVGGDLTLSGNVSIGSSSQPISKMNVVGSCPAPCSGVNKIWVNAPGVGHTLTPALTKPPVDLAGSYAAANPGPATGHDCQAGSNVPANFFDNDHTLNLSDGNINLFPPGVAYDCVVGSNEIKWDGSKNFMVKGTFYFDGNLNLAGNTDIVYSNSSGTLYFTGSMALSGNATLCGISNCASTWNPDKNGIVFVTGCWANSTGSSLVSSYCVNLAGNNTLQAAIYSATDYHAAGNAQDMGPVIANSITQAGNVSVFIPFHTLPAGAPVNTTTVTTTTTGDGTPQSPANWNG